MTLSARALLLDMDGVLVDSEELMSACAIDALGEWGVIAVREDFEEFIGAGEDKFIGGVAQRHGVDYDTAMKDRAYALYAERATSIAFPGVCETLHSLKKQGFKLGVCSGADRVKVLINIRAIGLPEDFFDFMVSGGEVKLNKPHPDIFLLGMNRLGLTPTDCIVVEDSLNGIRAAQRAGMRAIAVTSSFSEDELKAQVNPDVIIDDIRSLPSILSLN